VKEALKRVERAATRQARAHSDLHAAIIAAHGQGASQRAIAKAAGLSNTHVKRILDAAKNG
jgi:DNA-binding transcriptional regulator LsrR (DeoR family)